MLTFKHFLAFYFLGGRYSQGWLWGLGTRRVVEALVYRDVSPVMSLGSGGMWGADTQGLYGKEEKNLCGG